LRLFIERDQAAGYQSLADFFDFFALASSACVDCFAGG
jgi:hypothetical protein